MLSSNVNLNINKLMLRLRLPLSAIITNIVSYPTDFSPTPLITSMFKCLMVVLYVIKDNLSEIREFFYCTLDKFLINRVKANKRVRKHYHFNLYLKENHCFSLNYPLICNRTIFFNYIFIYFSSRHS